MVEAILGLLLAIATASAVTIPVALWYAFAASQLWEWFIVAHLPCTAINNIADVGYLHDALAAATQTTLRQKIEVKDEDMPNFIFEIVLTPLLALAAGYVIKFWFM